MRGKQLLIGLVILWTLGSFGQLLFAGTGGQVYLPLISQPPAVSPTAQVTTTATATITATSTATRTATQTATSTATVTGTATATATGTATTTATTTATATGTATTTATATGTATPTATAQPGDCIPVLPIAINRATLDLSSEFFIDPQIPGDFGVIETELEFWGRTYRRLYFDTESPEVHFARWRATQTSSGLPATSTEALVESLSGGGNLFDGFEEVVPWPSDGPEPAEYPEFPGQLSSGDWIYGTGAGYGTQPITDVLKVLSDTQQIIILPLYNEFIGQGNNAQLSVVGVRMFVIIDYGYLPGRGNYLTLIALGDIASTSVPICGLPPPARAERGPGGLISTTQVYLASP
jgi:hypothetical protein